VGLAFATIMALGVLVNLDTMELIVRCVRLVIMDILIVNLVQIIVMAMDFVSRIGDVDVLIDM